MASQFDELLMTTAHDGALTPLGVCSPPPGPDIDQLMAAWFEERHACIETRLFLEEASRLIRRVLLDGELTSANKRRLRRFIRAIREVHVEESEC